MKTKTWKVRFFITEISASGSITEMQYAVLRESLNSYGA
jgi:hypothetical protein